MIFIRRGEASEDLRGLSPKGAEAIRSTADKISESGITIGGVFASASPWSRANAGELASRFKLRAVNVVHYLADRVDAPAILQGLRYEFAMREHLPLVFIGHKSTIAAVGQIFCGEENLELERAQAALIIADLDEPQSARGLGEMHIIRP